MKTLREIIIDKLKELGADGVCNPDLDCGCGIDDFEPCETISLIECVPAKHMECVDCPDNGKCEYQSILGAERCYRRLSEEK